MAGGIASGINLGIGVANAERRARQQELENNLKGFEKDEEGFYNPNALGQARLDNELVKANNAKFVNTAKAEAFKGLDALQAVNPMTDIVQGNTLAGWSKIQSNPNLLQAFNDVGIQEIAPIDLHNDKQLLEASGINTSVINTSDKQLLAGINSGFTKTRDAEGKWSITPTRQLYEVTNVASNISTKDNTAWVNAFNKMNDIYSSRKLLTPAEQEAKDNVTAYNSTKAQVGNIEQTAILDNVNKVLANPNATIEEIRTALSPSTQLERDKLDLASRRVDVASDTLDFKIQQLEAEKLKAKDPASAKNVTAELNKLKLEKNKREAEKAREIESHPEWKVHEGILPNYIKDSSNFITTNEAGAKVFDMPKWQNVVEQAQRWETNNKVKPLDNTKTDKITSYFYTAREANKLADIVDNVDYGAITKIGSVLRSYGGNVADILNTDEMKEAVAIDSSIGNLVKAFAQATSGLAVTDAEYLKLLEIVVGGDYTTSQAKASRLRQFSKDTRSKGQSKLDNVAISNPATYMRMDYDLKQTDLADKQKEAYLQEVGKAPKKFKLIKR